MTQIREESALLGTPAPLQGQLLKEVTSEELKKEGLGDKIGGSSVWVK